MSPVVTCGLDLLPTVLAEFDVHTTETVVAELKDPQSTTISRETPHDESFDAVTLAVHTVDKPEFESSRIDAGEGSCVIPT